MSRKHQFAQHFLASPVIAAELIGHSNIRKNDIVYDLGAGSGVISAALSGRVREVVSVEVELDALKQLRRNMMGYDNVTIIASDIETFTPNHEDYIIFANPPFSIIASLVRRYTSLPNSPRALYLIVQKQFAFKIIPSDRHFTSQLGIQLAPFYKARIRKSLRKKDFTPPPAVDTVLLELKKRENTMLPYEAMCDYQAFVSQCFSDPRRLITASRRLPYKLTRTKPSELSPEVWVELYTLR